ncbi:hypothetical protein ACMFMG_009870 [Clarireedia jacksonii]
MAVLNSLPGITVSICVKDKALLEYDCDDFITTNAPKDPAVAEYQSQRTVAKYIESIADAQYEIRCTMRNPYTFEGNTTSLGFRALVDGSLLYPCVLIPKQECLDDKFVNVTFKGNEYQDSMGNQFLQRLKFIKVQTTANGTTFASDMLEDREGESLGMIEIHVHGLTDDHKSKFSSGKAAPSLATYEIDENKLKGQAKSHGTPYGKAIKSRGKWEIFTSSYSDGEEYPIAIFKFRYGSKKDLQALGVIARDPEPQELAVADVQTTPPSSSSATQQTPSSEPVPAALQATPPFTSLIDRGLGVDRSHTFQLFEQFLQLIQAPANTGVPAPAGLKMEGSSIGHTIKHEQNDTAAALTASPATPIKREHKEGEVQTPCKRPRKDHGKVTVTIDLSADDSDHAIEVD